MDVGLWNFIGLCCHPLEYDLFFTYLSFNLFRDPVSNSIILVDHRDQSSIEVQQILARLNYHIHLELFLFLSPASVVHVIELVPSVRVGLWELRCAPPRGYQTMYPPSTCVVHHRAAWCTMGTYVCEKWGSPRIFSFLMGHKEHAKTDTFCPYSTIVC